MSFAKPNEHTFSKRCAKCCAESLQIGAAKERLSMLQASDEFWADEHETFVEQAAQDTKESAQHNAQHLQAASGCLSCRHDAYCVYSWRPVVVDGVSCWQPPTAMQ